MYFVRYPLKLGYSLKNYRKWKMFKLTLFIHFGTTQMAYFDFTEKFSLKKSYCGLRPEF
jgi:hypothetical protein